MTVTLNLSDTQMTFISTSFEVNPVTSGSTLVIFNKYTNVQYEYELPNDSSPYPDRYNEFIVETSVFSGLTPGQYTFKIKDSINNVTETGMLKVIKESLTPENGNDFIYIQQTENDDDYLVYTP